MQRENKQREAGNPWSGSVAVFPADEGPHIPPEGIMGGRHWLEELVMLSGRRREPFSSGNCQERLARSEVQVCTPRGVIATSP